MFQLYLLQLLVAVLAENGQSEPCDKGSGLPKSLNHQERRSVRVIWEEPKSPQQALMVKWKKRTTWIPRRSLTLKTKLRRRSGFSGIRVGEATHPGPAEIFWLGIQQWRGSRSAPAATASGYSCKGSRNQKEKEPGQEGWTYGELETAVLQRVEGNHTTCNNSHRQRCFCSGTLGWPVPSLISKDPHDTFE